MSRVLKQIRTLLALAAGDGEEARTAAHIAAKLIREHGVTLSMPSHAVSDEDVPAGYEDLAPIFNMVDVAPPWKGNPQWATELHRRAATQRKQRSHRQPQSSTRAERSEKGAPLEQSAASSQAPDPFDFVTAEEAAKRGR